MAGELFWKKKAMSAPQVRWHKSSHSSANGQCVEVTPVSGTIAVRDSKNPAGPELIFTRQAWVAFVEGREVLAGRHLALGWPVRAGVSLGEPRPGAGQGVLTAGRLFLNMV